MRLLTLLLLAVLAAGPAAAQQPAVTVDHPWARATPGAARTGAFYFTVTNSGSAPDRLLSASSPVAESAQLHSSQMVDGVMQMRPVASLDLAPGAAAVLQPNGMHMMLMGLKQPLKRGDQVPLTLRFEHAGAITVDVPVEAPGAMGPDPMAGMSHAMPGTTK